MHRLVVGMLTTSALVAFSVSASAADLPARMPTKAPPYVPPYSWSGLYVGVNLGGSWGRQDNTLETITGVIDATNSNHIDGVIGGGQIGFNWQYNQWVVGLEADIQGSGQKGDGSFFIPAVIGATVVPATSISYEDKLNWFGTVRGRIGWAFDRWMPYFTGGWAFGHGEVNGTTAIGATATSFSGSKDYSGWTVGGGVEWAFYDRWSAKLEYLYIDFGDGPTVAVSPTRNILSDKLTDNIVRAGLNYKFY